MYQEFPTRLMTTSIKKLKDCKQLSVSMTVCSAGILQTSIYFTF